MTLQNKLTMPAPITVHVNHDAPLLAAGLAATLYPHPEFRVVAGPIAAESMLEVQVIVTSYKQGVALREQMLQQFGAQAPAILIVALPMHARRMLAAVKLGVQGYLLQTCPLEELLNGVRTLAQGQCYITPAVVAEIAHSVAQARLTAREHDILRLLCKGHGNQAISQALEISLNTVKVHVKSLMRKLDAETRTQAVVIAIEQGWIDKN